MDLIYFRPFGSVWGPRGVRSWSVRGPFGVRAGSVRDPRGVRSGSVRGPLGVHPGSVRRPFGVRSGFVRGQFGPRNEKRQSTIAANLPREAVRSRQDQDNLRKSSGFALKGFWTMHRQMLFNLCLEADSGSKIPVFAKKKAKIKIKSNEKPK